MISAAAWASCARGTWGEHAACAGARAVLLALWDHAHGWREGEPAPFVFPSVDTLACKLGVSERTIYRGLAELEALGWLRREVERRRVGDRWDDRSGWRLALDPRIAAKVEEVAVPQLDLFAAEAVDNPRADAEITDKDDSDLRQGCQRTTDKGVTPSYGTEIKQNVTSANDDADVLRTWHASEAERVRFLGGRPAQPSPPPDYVAAARRWGTERLGKAAIDGVRLAADARSRGRHVASDLVAACTDARAWTDRRIEAIEARMQAIGGELVCAAEAVPRSHAPADPVVDGQRVTMHERDAYERGGDDAVRALRAEPEITAERCAAELAGKPWMRLVGGGT